MIRPRKRNRILRVVELHFRGEGLPGNQQALATAPLISFPTAKSHLV